MHYIHRFKNMGACAIFIIISVRNLIKTNNSSAVSITKIFFSHFIRSSWDVNRDERKSHLLTFTNSLYMCLCAITIENCFISGYGYSCLQTDGIFNMLTQNVADQPSNWMFTDYKHFCRCKSTYLTTFECMRILNV